MPRWRGDTATGIPESDPPSFFSPWEYVLGFFITQEIPTGPAGPEFVFSSQTYILEMKKTQCGSRRPVHVGGSYVPGRTGYGCGRARWSGKMPTNFEGRRSKTDQMGPAGLEPTFPSASSTGTSPQNPFRRAFFSGASLLRASIDRKRRSVVASTKMSKSEVWDLNAATRGPRSAQL